MFWLCNIASSLLSLVNIPLLVTESMDSSIIAIGVMSIIAFIIFLLNSFLISYSKKDMCALFFLLDTVMLTVIVALVGFAGMLFIIMPM